jgi:hypothetical protein
MKWEVPVRFVVIGVIVDCFKLAFHITKTSNISCEELPIIRKIPLVIREESNT